MAKSINDSNATSVTSVLVPAYNHAQFIEACLDSVARETWPRIELIIVDDASTDDTYSLAKEWLSRNPGVFERAVLLRNQVNLGVGRTLNKLVAASTGTYLTVVASDDLLAAGGIQARVDALRGSNSRGAVIGDCWLIDGDGIVRRESAYVVRHRANLSALSSPRAIRRELILNWSVPGPVLLFHRDLVQTLGGRIYAEDLVAEDRDLYLRLMAADQLRFVDFPVAYYRWHHSNASAIHVEQIMGELVQAERRHMRSFPPRFRVLIGFVVVGRVLRTRAEERGGLWHPFSVVHRAVTRITYRCHAALARRQKHELAWRPGPDGGRSGMSSRT
ncbi:glycosyltransferase [Aeromicrobium sp. SMF47]|uniref:glycosyltransferase family 2 protein n=1 Tax=Aeromicrobium yanjiei TaxID=2662028 RepID=UPI00129E9807|nr:glycosyltransferase [Aeromicrobium yanjiei]MRJ75563.1 glycosyltransferase [Aeromicrobium yanjiei]